MLLRRKKIEEFITHYAFCSKAPLIGMVKGEIKRPYGACIINSLNDKRK
jgi:hypothetical protein